LGPSKFPSAPHRSGYGPLPLASVQDAARRAIEGHQQLELTVRDSKAFVDALLNPKPVNDRLVDTVRRYREASGA
jgi:uncharacterized protein (DUF1778 family)